jgi:hypothetical protein
MHDFCAGVVMGAVAAALALPMFSAAHRTNRSR